MDYTVEIRKESGNISNVGTTTRKHEAIALARKTAQGCGDQVFITWYRASDGQIGYLNEDGHNPVGRPW